MIKLLLIFTLHANAIEFDKSQHLVASTIISSATYTACIEAKCKAPRMTAFLFTMITGLTKELSDERVDSKDLIFDAIGAALPLTLTWEF